MASLFKRPRSPFWWVNWRNPATDRVERLSTGFRHGLAIESQRARKLCAEFTVKEVSVSARVSHTRWEVWVDTFFEHNYPKLTRDTYAGKWRRVHRFLIEKKLFSPGQVRREHAMEYVAWRTKLGNLHSDHLPIARNTALGELRVLGLVLKEAIARDYLETFPLTGVKMERDPARPKSEISPADMAIIRAEIARLRTHPQASLEKVDFYHVSFEIAAAQGIRLHETHFRLADVDWVAWTIPIKMKGNKYEHLDLSPSLRPLLERLRDEGREWTYDKPWNPPLAWWKLFDRLRKVHPHLKHTSFHSTRVTVVSVLNRAVPESVAMKMVKHASTTIHRRYRRVLQTELVPAWKALEILNPPSADTTPAAGTPGAPPSIADTTPP